MVIIVELIVLIKNFIIYFCFFVSSWLKTFINTASSRTRFSGCIERFKIFAWFAKFYPLLMGSFVIWRTDVPDILGAHYWNRRLFIHIIINHWTIILPPTYGSSLWILTTKRLFTKAFAAPYLIHNSLFFYQPFLILSALITTSCLTFLQLWFWWFIRTISLTLL